MLAEVLFVITTLSFASSQSPNHAPNVPPVIKQCFYEGRWFPAGSVIKAGRSVNWCYGSYCDLDGIVRHWDDYNCPPPTGSNPLPSLPNPQQTTTTTTTPVPPTTAPPTFWFPTTTQSSFSNFGCFYQGNFFWAGQDIYNKKRGRRCLGAYCDWNSKVQHWEDDCRYTMSPSTPANRQPAFNTPIDRT